MWNSVETPLFFKFNPFKPYAVGKVPAACNELREVKLLYVQLYVPEIKSLVEAKNMWYYREPLESEYPIDLTKGFERYIPISSDNFFKESFNQIANFIEKNQHLLSVINSVDFFTNRHTLFHLMNTRMACEFQLVASKVKGHIFLCLEEKTTVDRRSGITRRDTYNFKMRQHVIVDKFGDTPNTDAAYDERKKLYGIFSAKLGRFNLIYSAELCCVTNKEPLGDLKDPKVLAQCNLTAIKVCSHSFLSFREQINWCIQALFVGIKEFRVGRFDENGHIKEPIEHINYDKLVKQSSCKLPTRLQLVHRFLQEIYEFMMESASPKHQYVFHVVGGSVYHYPNWVPNRNARPSKWFLELMERF